MKILSLKNIVWCYANVNFCFWLVILLLHITKLINGEESYLSNERELSSPYVGYMTGFNILSSILFAITFFVRKNKGNYYFKFSLPQSTVRLLFSLAVLNLIFRYDEVILNVQFLAYLLSIVLFTILGCFLFEEGYSTASVREE